MQAVIMAGGHGKRLRPLTCTMPKPMVPLLNKPVIDYCVELLTAHGITDIAATLHYLPEMIRGHLGDGRAFGAEIRYSVEDKPLGTAGSVAAVARPGEPVLVLSGDAITDVDLGALLRAHESSRAAATIVLKRVQVPTEYGVALMDETGRIRRFLEKPQLSQVFSDLANTGIYLLSPEAVDMIPKDTAYDFSMDLFPRMLAADMPIMGHVTESYWCDIGDLRAYVQAQRDMLAGKCAFETLAVERDGIFMEHDAKVSPEAVLVAPCYIGRDAEVAGGAILADGTVLCSGVRVGAGSSIKRSILLPGARVREHGEIRGAVIAEGAQVDDQARIFAGTALGAGSHVGKGASITAGACLWPNKQVEDGATCQEDVIWDGGLHKNNLDTVVKGYTDGELGPERAARIGAAFVKSQKGAQKELAIATDGSQQAVMLKHGAMAGMVSQGGDVYDLGHCSYSAFTHGIRSYGLHGGVYIRRDGDGPHGVEMALCDGQGCRLSGGGFRSFRQELLGGPHPPLTAQRLGIIQQLGGAAKGYEAQLAGILEPGVRAGGYKVILSGDGDLYDIAARVLLPAGYSVLYMAERQAERLHGSMIQQGAELGFAMEGTGELTCIFRDRYLNESQRILLFIQCALAEGRLQGHTGLPVGISEEYAAHLESLGCKVHRCPEDREKWKKQALSHGCYLPELFEPEAAVIRLSQMGRQGRLAGLVEQLPHTYEAEGSVGCSWKEMGRVMRSLVETERSDRVELMDGVKVQSDKGWVLIRPNGDLTAYRVVAGSFNGEYAKELTDLYLDKMRQIAQDKGNES